MAKNKRQNVTTQPSMNTLNAKIDRVMKMIPKGTFKNAGATAGMALGGPAGAAIGRTLGQGISAITGYGDYNVKSNTLSTVSTSVDTVPQFLRNDHSVRVAHREFVKDLMVPDVPSDFVNKTFVINPGNINLFPWLANFAKQYQTYLVHGMVVEFKSMSSDYAASGPLGTVAIATNYNVNDVPYPTKIALENSEFAVSSKPSRSIIHAIECEPEVNGAKYRYVRDVASESTATSDSRLYDLGLLQVATAGLPGQAGATLGELWVSYDIEFSKPVLPGTGSNSIPASILTSQLDGSVGLANGKESRILYTQSSQPTLGASASTKAFAGTLANIAASLDSGLDGTVTTINATGDITLYKNGVYRVAWTTYADCSSTKKVYVDIDGANTGTSVSATGAATYNAEEVCVVINHACDDPQSNKAFGHWSYTITVDGCGDDGGSGTVILAGPSFTTFSADLVTPSNSTAVVDWAQFKPENIVVVE